MKQRVTISKVEKHDTETAVREAVALASGLEELIKDDSRVLIKLNQARPAHSGSGLVTNAWGLPRL